MTWYFLQLEREEPHELALPELEAHARAPCGAQPRRHAKHQLLLSSASGVTWEVCASHYCFVKLPGKHHTHQLTTLLLLPGSTQGTTAAFKLYVTVYIRQSFKHSPFATKDITFPNYKTRIQTIKLTYVHPLKVPGLQAQPSGQAGDIFQIHWDPLGSSARGR